MAKAFPGQSGSMFVLRNGQPELMESSLLTYRETMKFSPGMLARKFISRNGQRRGWLHLIEQMASRFQKLAYFF